MTENELLQAQIDELKKTVERTWKELESSFATEVIEQSKRKTRKWFTAWIITLVALLVTWIFHE